MTRFRVTYATVTPESAARGDCADSGFIVPGGRRIESLVGRPTPGVDMSLRDALRFVNPQEDSGSWWSECDGRENYRTGAVETRSLHPPRNITQSSYDRVSRLLKI